MIPFSPPRIDDEIIKEVNDTLRSGWITTGPRTKQLEKMLTVYTGAETTLCLNSASAGLELVLRWFGVTEGDEVILPAYTYTATANVVKHVGATPVFVDSNKDDFNIDVNAVRNAITEKTKVIMPVDLGGMPCDYNAINALVREEEIAGMFSPNSEEQKKLGRILVLSDAAHSLGAIYNGKRCGALTDVTVFSFHAVKNLTTAEGGAIQFKLPAGFDHDQLYKDLCIKSLHGQSKDALAKTKIGAWKYDVVEAGYKCNMTDIQAAIGLVELKRYDNDMLVKRKYIFDRYTKAFQGFKWADCPLYEDRSRRSSYHVYMLRINGIDEAARDRIMEEIFARGVSVNVHFRPLPLMTYYKSLGYDMEKYPQAYENYSREISLPVYYDLTDDQLNQVINAVSYAVEKVLKSSK